jgi:transposase
MVTGRLTNMGHLVMSEKERLYKAVFEMVKQGRLTLQKAAKQTGLSYRQTKRIYKRYKAEGDAGLMHKLRGRESNRKHPDKPKIIARYIERYKGFGPTLAAEKLMEEDHLNVNHETLREWLLKERLWHKQRKRSPYRQQRECRAQFGELIHIDGSIHDWFGDGKYSCLLNMVDDATSKTLAYLESGETTRSIFLVMKKWIERYGIPLAFYVDLKNVYVSMKETSTFTHVEKACKKLGIRIIKAYSPQAKGRVERKHAVYQDRFVKELYLKQINTIEAANELLENGFIDKLNRKFEKPARNPESAHLKRNRIDLNQVLCWEYERQVQNDWTFSFMNYCFQVEKRYGSFIRPKAKVLVRRHLDGSITAWYKDEKLSITQLERKPDKVEIEDQIKCRKALSAHQSGKLGKRRSPWGQFNPNWLKKTGTGK